MVRKIEMKPVSRRDLMKFVGAGTATGVVATLLPNLALADAASAAAAIQKVTGGKTPASGKITFSGVPQIAENGNTVPVGFEVESPMSDSNYVKSVHIFADKNPRPDVGAFHFTPGCGVCKASTRMRMAKTQNVIAVAAMSDGSVFMAKTEVKVTIGGCGG
jgi:sulfur-oxidizing protein SoxY